jgi:hypothetical protein
MYLVHRDKKFIPTFLSCFSVLGTKVIKPSQDCGILLCLQICFHSRKVYLVKALDAI